MRRSRAPSQIGKVNNSAYLEEMKLNSSRVLLTCLEEMLIPDPNSAIESIDFKKFPSEDAVPEQKKWVSGAATEIMNRFYNNGTSPIRTHREADSSDNTSSFSSSHRESKNAHGRDSYLKEQNIPNPGLFTTLSSSSLTNTPRNFNGLLRSEAPSTSNNCQVLPKLNGCEEMPGPGSKEPCSSKTSFKTAYEQMLIDDKAKGIKRSMTHHTNNYTDGPGNPARKMPKLDNDSSNKEGEGLSHNPEVNALMSDERLKNIEAKMVEAILNEVVEMEASTDWDDIAGLSSVKSIIKEVVIWPIKRPDIFTGLRSAPRGILLFGPPGTGKTMFGRLIATQSDSTFFNISASSLMSKWCGDGEKMVRALFQVARVKQPAVIFIDEIDSILTQRSDSEHETSRRLKTEFLIQFDGCATSSEDKILVIGVTNRPQELDEAARRRLVKRIYIPLPDTDGRQQLVRNLLRDQSVSLMDVDYERIADLTEGFSGADMASLCKDAAYGPIRDIGHDIQNIQVTNVRPIQVIDFEHSLKTVRASVAPKDLTVYEEWDKQFGCRA